MRVLRTLLVGCLLVGFLPGFVELGEDMLHLVMEGHTLHTTDHDGEEERPSHGCDDCTHCVSCHGQGTPFVAAGSAHVGGPTTLASPDYERYADGVALDGVRARIDRPPQA